MIHLTNSGGDGMPRLPLFALLLISIMFAAGCHRDPGMEEENVAKDEFILSYVNQFRYVIKEERPLPDTLNHRAYALLGADGQLAYAEDYASFQGNIEPTPFFEGKGFGWQGETSGPVPLSGTFSMIAYQTREATISKEQFVYVVPFHLDEHSAYQVAHEREYIKVYQHRDTPVGNLYVQFL